MHLLLSNECLRLNRCRIADPEYGHPDIYASTHKDGKLFVHLIDVNYNGSSVSALR